MIPASQEIIDAINEPSRTFKARLLTSLDPVTELECNVFGVEIHTGGGGETPIPGAMFASYITATIQDVAVPIKGLDVYLQIGVVTSVDDEGAETIGWLPSNGLYRIIKTEVKENQITFTGVGRLTSHFQGSYVSRLTYPTTIANVVNEIASMTGCTITRTGATINWASRIQKRIEGHTYAEAISIIAQLSGAFVTEDYRGYITLSRYNWTDTQSVDYTRFTQLPIFAEDKFTVTGLTCNVSEAEELEVDLPLYLGSFVYEYLNLSPSYWGTLNGDDRSFNDSGFEAGDVIGVDVKWSLVCTHWDSEEGEMVTDDEDSAEDTIEFTYGTAQTIDVEDRIVEDVSGTVRAIYRVYYDGANHIQAYVFANKANNYALLIGMSSMYVHQYVKRIAAVSYSDGTPNIAFSNEYMTQQMFDLVASYYKGYSFYPAEIALALGDPRIEPRDALSITNGTSSWVVPCNQIVTRFTGGLSQTISSLMAGVGDDDSEEVEGAMATKIDFALSQAGAAKAAADNAQSSASVAAEAAGKAQLSAGTAQAMADSASDAAKAAGDSADRAHQAADDAQGSADRAQTSADNASEYAARALGNLSTVQSVAETLNWITEHGTMTLTSDTELNPSHVYFVLNDPPTGQTEPHGDYYVGGHYYDVVSEPDVDDISTYYELTIDESLNNYVGTHLSVTGEGLWLIPEDSATGSRVLIATGQGSTYTAAGTYIIDSTGFTVASFTNSGLKLYGRDYQGNTIIYQNTAREDAFFKSRYAVLAGEVLRYFRTSILDRNGVSITHDRGPNSYNVKTFDVQDDYDPYLELRSVDVNGDNSEAYIKLGTADGDGIDIYYGGETDDEHVFHVDNHTGEIAFKCQGYSAGVSETAGGTITKAVIADYVSDGINDTIYAITFTNAPTSNVSLKINNSGVKQAYYNGSRINASNGAWSAGETVYFTYDGTRYQRTDNPDELAVAIGQLGWTSDVIV